jgi:hypothetical protein
MKFNDEFDQVLDDALAEYRETEPLAGLEDRVLQRLRLQTERRQRLWWRWSAIAAAAAVVLMAAWIGLGDRTRRDVVAPSVVQKQAQSVEPQPPQVDTRTADAYPASKPTPVAKAASRKTPVLVAAELSREPTPMPERFPSPLPLKPEERMLLALATTHTEILMGKTGDDKEIVIDPINIKPLVDETGAYQGEN